MCALVDALQDWTANSRVRLALEHHGRMQEICDTVDLTHTVGWLTSIYPLAIESKSAGSVSYTHLAGDESGARERRVEAEPSGLCDLHVGEHRNPERGDGGTSQCQPSVRCHR